MAITPDTLQTWLDEALQAQHDLAIGAKAVSVSSSSGRSVTFTQADAKLLDAHIQSLRRQLGLAPGVRAFTFQVGGH